MNLRQYQLDALAAIRKAYLEGTRSQLVACATGTGKGVMFACLPRYVKDILPGQTLLLAHRSELLDQAISKMRQANPDLKVSKEQAGEVADTDSDVIVASVATLGRKGTKRTQRFNWDNIDKIVTDEGHHANVASYLNIYETAGLNHPDNKKLHVGFTATPNRADGKALSQVYEKIVYSYGLRQAIEEGWLCDIRGLRTHTTTDISSVASQAGDFDLSELASTVNTPIRNQEVVKAWLESCEDRKTVVFAVDIQHAKDLSLMFSKYGVRSEAVWGVDPDRKEKLKRFEEGPTRVLTNVGILLEGYDHPPIACVVLSRPTRSGVSYAQSIGRGTRLFEGKKDLLVLDVVDASSRHSLITLPTLLGMAPGLDLKGKSLVKSLVKLEEAFKKTPYADFSKLTDIDKLETFVQEIDLFTVRVPEEVLNNSLLSWNRSADGGFLLMLPSKDFVAIKQNLLDIWTISAKIANNTYRGERGSLAEAFKAADKLVTDKVPECLKLLKREGQDWHKDEPTEGQLKLLTKFFRGQPLPTDLTKGRASSLIGQFLSGKKRKVTA